MKITITHNPNKTVDHDYWKMYVAYNDQIWRETYHAPETMPGSIIEVDSPHDIPEYTPIKGLACALQSFAKYLLHYPPIPPEPQKTMTENLKKAFKEWLEELEKEKS